MTFYISNKRKILTMNKKMMLLDGARDIVELDEYDVANMPRKSFEKIWETYTASLPTRVLFIYARPIMKRRIAERFKDNEDTATWD